MWFILFLAYFFLRIYNLQSLQLSLQDGFQMNLPSGFILDLGFILILFGCTSVFQKKKIPALIFTIGYIGQVAYSLYLKFFQTELDLWHIGYHLLDLTVIQGSSFALAYELWFFLSLFFFFLFLLKYQPKKSFRNLFILIPLGLIIKQSPAWLHWIEFDQVILDFKPNILNEHFWFKIFRGNKKITLVSLTKAKKIIENFINKPYPGEKIALQSDRDVIIIFIESFRAIEFNNLEIRKTTMPKFSKLVKEKGFFFKTAYSSSIDAGQTVRGIFQSNCSFYPNFLYPAVYLSKNNIKLDCLPQVLKKADYKTISIVPTEKNFHHSYTFEKFHGIDFSFGKEEIEKKFSKVDYFEDWAVSDKEVFRFGKQFLHEQSSLFLQLLTINSHFPYTGESNPKLKTIADKYHYDKEGHIYLSRLSTLDHDLSDFILQVLKLRKNPLIVILGDHSISQGQRSHLSRLQLKEALYRIPIVIFGDQVGESEHLIHQIDLAPTLLGILNGTGSGTWLGKDFFKYGGSPFVVQDAFGVSSRRNNEACYAFMQSTTCGTWTTDAFLGGDFIPGSGYQVTPTFIEAIRSVIASDGIK